MMVRDGRLHQKMFFFVLFYYNFAIARADCNGEVVI